MRLFLLEPSPARQGCLTGGTSPTPLCPLKYLFQLRGNSLLKREKYNLKLHHYYFMFVGINLFWNIDSIWQLVTHVYALYVRVQILQNISPFLKPFQNMVQDLAFDQ
jgi:hypothetical protein